MADLKDGLVPMYQAYTDAKAKIQALPDENRKGVEEALDVLWEQMQRYTGEVEHKHRVNRVLLALAARYWTCYAIDSRQSTLARSNAKQKLDQLVLEVEQRERAARLELSDKADG